MSVAVEDLSKLKVAELKVELKKLGLPTSGQKNELLNRLKDALQAESAEDQEQEEEEVLQEEEDEEIILSEEQPQAEESLEVPNTATAETNKPVLSAISTNLSETERLKKRAEKFGIMNEDLKKQVRAERFGLTQKSSNTGGKISMNVTSDVDVLKKRAERFGTVTSSTLTKVESADKLKQRAERFGTVLAPSLSKTAEQERLLKRKERFGIINSSSVTGKDDLQAKKQKRAERFGLT